MPRIIKCTLQIENTRQYVNKWFVCKQNGSRLMIKVTLRLKILLELI